MSIATELFIAANFAYANILTTRVKCKQLRLNAEAIGDQDIVDRLRYLEDELTESSRSWNRLVQALRDSYRVLDQCEQVYNETQISSLIDDLNLDPVVRHTLIERLRKL